MMKPTLGFALTGSFCTIRRALELIEELQKEYRIVPIVSETVARTDTRFIPARETLETLEKLCGMPPLCSIPACEPIGPQKMLDLLAVCPCTGNTLSKIARGVTDTSVTMAVKAHRRNRRPVILGLSTNDALSGSAPALGELLSRDGFYFVPFGQDDPAGKPASLLCRFDLLADTLRAARSGRQLQPLLA